MRDAPGQIRDEQDDQQDREPEAHRAEHDRHMGRMTRPRVPFVGEPLLALDER
jgi:hypothetical protein